MTQEEKILLLKDLCSRLSDGVKGLHRGQVHELFTIDSREVNNACIQVDGYDAWFPIETFKPYLRPMSSMTEEESKEFALLQTDFYVDGVLYPIAAINMINWLNSHHFDYRGLIPMGLALEAKEGMYKTE